MDTLSLPLAVPPLLTGAAGPGMRWQRETEPSTGSMIPSHTAESRVSKSQGHAWAHQRGHQPILLFATFQSLSEVGETRLPQGPHDGQALCWSALVGPQEL